MRRAFAVLLTALLLMNPCLPGVALAPDDVTVQHVSVTPVITGTQAEDGTYTSPVRVDFTVTPGDPDLMLRQLEVSTDGATWWPYEGWPLGFSDGTHTAYWRIAEIDPVTTVETLYTGEVSFTVALEHASVEPVITGTQAEDGTYTSPVRVDFTVTPGDPDLMLRQLEVSIDGATWWPYEGWPLGFSDGTHTAYWRIAEIDPVTTVETLYTDEVSFTVALEHASVEPIIVGEPLAEGVYRGPVMVALLLKPGDVGPALFDIYVDGVLQPASGEALMFADGTHTIAWELTEYGLEGPCEHVGEVTFTVLPGIIAVAPTVIGKQGDAGWYTSAVRVLLDRDPESAPLDYIEWSLDGLSWQPYVADIPVTAEGHTALYYRGISAWGEAGATQALDIAIDTRAPWLDVVSPMRDERVLLNASERLDWRSEDGVSGLAPRYPQPAVGELLDTGKVGDHSVTVIARDLAGNETVLSAPYRVIYGFRGFDKPIAMDGGSAFRIGETVAVKFSLVDAFGVSVGGAQSQLRVAHAHDPETVVSTDIFRETKTGKYCCDLTTEDLAPGEYVITAVLDDGESYSAIITLR